MNPLRKIAFGGAMAGTALLGGALGASLIGTANAQTTSDSTSTTTATSSTATPPPDARRRSRLEQGRPPGQRHHRDGAHRRRADEGHRGR